MQRFLPYLIFVSHGSLTFWHFPPLLAVPGDAVLGAGVGVGVWPGDGTAGFEVTPYTWRRGEHKGPVLAIGESGTLSSTAFPIPEDKDMTSRSSLSLSPDFYDRRAH